MWCGHIVPFCRVSEPSLLKPLENKQHDTFKNIYFVPVHKADTSHYYFLSKRQSIGEKNLNVN